MKTFGQIINTIFNNESKSISDISTELQNLPVSDSLKNVTTTVKNTVIYKAVSALNDSSQASCEIVDWIDDAVTEKRYGASNDNAMLLKLARNITTKFPDVGLYNIATILGRPVYLTVGVNPNDNTKYYIIDSRKNINSVTYFNEDNRGILIVYSEGLGDYFVSDYTGLFSLGDDKYVDISSLADQCAIGANTNECLMHIMNSATATGFLSPDQAINIIDQYAPSETLDNLKTYLSSLPTCNQVTIASIIAKVMNDSEGSYTSGNDYYTPYDTPTYVDDIIGLVTNLALTLLPLILSIVFRSFALIIFIATDVLTKVVSFIKDKTHLTTCSVERVDSILPVWNYPITTLTGVDLRSCPNYNEIKETITNFGCACAVNQNFGSSFYSLIFPAGTTNGEDFERYTVQIMPCANAFELGLDVPGYNYTFHQPDFDDNTWWVQIEKTDYVKVSVVSTDPLTADYAYMSQDELVTALFRSIVFSGIANDSQAPFITKINLESGLDIMALVKILELLDNASTLTDQQKRFCLWVIIKEVTALDPSFDWGSTFSHDISVIPDLLDKDWLTNGLVNQIMSYDNVIVCGIDALKPTIKWPLLEKSDVIWSCILAGATAAAVTAGTFIVKKRLKKKAVARLSLREAEFDDAKKQYQANPTPENLTVMNKANRKLTRAWNKAGRVGVSMYNGFSCGSNNETVVSDLASSFNTDTMQNKGAFDIIDVLQNISPKYTLSD